MELIVILVLALVVLGPQRIPEVASSLGKAIRGFRKATRELRDQIDIEEEVRRPFEDLRAALRDEPAHHRPIIPPALLTAAGDPNFPVAPIDPNFVPAGHGPVGAPVFAPSGALAPAEAAAAGEPGSAVAPAAGSSAEPALPAAPGPLAAAPMAAPSLVAPPAEPVVSANSGADHFQRAGQAAAPAKGAS